MQSEVRKVWTFGKGGYEYPEYYCELGITDNQKYEKYYARNLITAIMPTACGGMKASNLGLSCD